MQLRSYLRGTTTLLRIKTCRKLPGESFLNRIPRYYFYIHSFVAANAKVDNAIVS